jgi:DNA-binding PadR family transcriptional regulator
MTDLIVLLPLWDGPKHGYRLKKEAGLILGTAEVHNNIVYPLLRRFTSRGLVRKKVVRGERGQNRQLYTLTPLGRKTVIQRLREFGEHESRSPEGFLLRVGMFGILRAADRARIRGERERVLLARGASLSRIKDEMKVDAYGGEVIRYLLERIRFESNWIKRLRRTNRRKP